MPYPQDLTGKFINYRIHPGGNPKDLSARVVKGCLPGQTTTASLDVHDCEQTSKPKGKFQIVLSSLNPRPKWSFTFLNYEPGYVTTARLNKPVLTGPMSGCYLFTYNYCAAPMLAHVGTYQGQNTKQSIAAKQSWIYATKDTDISSISGCNPFDYFRNPDMSTVRGIPGKPNIFGYFTGTAAYAIMFFNIAQSHSSLGNTLHKTVCVKKMTLMPWSSILAMRTFKGVDESKDPYGMKEIRKI
jgi:hypothetical protein